MWRHLLEKLRDLSAAGRASAYERAKLCAALFADEGYLDDCAARRRAASDELSELTNDLAVDAGALAQMFKAFPEQSDWDVTPLRVLYTETIAKIRQNQRNHWNPRKRTAAEREEAIAAREDERTAEQERAWQLATAAREKADSLNFDDDEGELEAREDIDLVSAFEAAAPSEKLRLLRSREFLTWLQQHRGVRVVDDALDMLSDEDEAAFESYLHAKGA